MPLMKIREVADELGVSVTFVYDLLNSGRLKHHALGKTNGAKRVSREHLDEYLRGVEKGGAAPKPIRTTPSKLKHLVL